MVKDINDQLRSESFEDAEKIKGSIQTSSDAILILYYNLILVM
jgi:hypothetical protein